MKFSFRHVEFEFTLETSNCCLSRMLYNQVWSRQPCLNMSVDEPGLWKGYWVKRIGGPRTQPCGTPRIKDCGGKGVHKGD